MPEAVRGRTGNGSCEGVEEGALMGENKQVESEKKVSEDNKIELEQNKSEQSSEELGMVDVKDKDTFFSLCPSILENNEEYKSYYEALDYAFDNNDIKNIAITGIYGAGKSTVWKSYARERALNNIITITLGQYERADHATYGSQLESKVGSEKDRNCGISELEQENRIERKLIHQIISQIPIEDTPLSKYKIKSNKNIAVVLREVMLIISFFLAIIFWLEKDWISYCLKEICKSEYKFLISVLSLIFFIVPMCYFLFRFVKYQKMSIQKIQFKGVETNINDGNIEDESILDKDIKEIIYLLTSAKIEVLVIEDLDRFDDINIFIKLRELNYMLNQHFKVNNIKRIARFVYMVRDGILGAKDRVKFFDFVLPVLPYICSKNSESILSRGLGQFGFDSNNRLIIATSLYIDEMRILKNIINEYQIYEKILNINEKQIYKEILKINGNLSRKDKLLSILVIKNLFPYQFDLLQMNQGYLYNLFHKKEEYIKAQDLESAFRDAADISHLFNFLTTLYSIGKVDDYFKFVAEDPNILKNHYFSLIKLLVIEGYFAEDYYFYISPFHEGGLNIKDRIFMQKLFEGDDNIFTEIYKPESIYKRLSEADYKKSNVLNITLLRDSLMNADLMSVEYPYLVVDKESRKRVEMLIDCVCRHNNYKALLVILSYFHYSDIRRYVDIAIQSKIQHIETILEIVSGKSEIDEDKMLVDLYYDQHKFDKDLEYREIQDSILRAMMMFPQKEVHTFFYEIKGLKEILENGSSVLLVLKKNEVNTFFENLISEKIFFKDLDFWQNLNDMVCDILSKEILFEEFLSSIYICKELTRLYEYIQANFDEFIEMYIRDLQENEVRNIESVVVDILNSNISEEDKIIYIEKNRVQIKDINKLTIPLDGNIAKKLYLKDTISCSQENISRCYADKVLSGVPEFVDYLNRNINSENEKDILEDNSELCEELLTCEKTGEELFGLAIKYAENPLDIGTFSWKIPENKCLLLIENKRIEISESNIQRLVDLSYTKSIYKWLKLAKGKEQDDLVEFLSTANLDKIRDRLEIFLRHLKEENAKKLIDKVKGEMKIYRIAPNRTEIKKYLLLNFPITTENIQYICKYFKDFKFKQEFLDSLTSHNQFQDFTDEDLNKDVMNYLLTSTLVSIENKVKFLQTKIQNEVEHSELKEYIDSVDEIKDLNEVWNHKQPKLNNTYKQDIRKALADNGYVKIRNDSPNPYIVLVDKKKD